MCLFTLPLRKSGVLCMAKSSSWADQIDAEDAQAASTLPISTVNQGAAAGGSSIGPANQALLDGAVEARVLADLAIWLT